MTNSQQCWTKCFLVAVGFLLIPNAETRAAPPVRVFILTGQSNMEGKGRALHLDTYRNDPLIKDTYSILKQNDEWVTRDDVWITYPTKFRGEKHGKLTIGYGTKGDDSIGPEFGFGHTVGEAMEEPVLLIKVAWGGKSLAVDFRPPSAGLPPQSDLQEKLLKLQKKKPETSIDDVKATYGFYYRMLVKETKSSLSGAGDMFPELKDRELKIAGIVWHQGFNDVINRDLKENNYIDYTKWLQMFIKELRRDLDASAAPFVIGELSTGGIPNRGEFQKAQAAAADLPEFQGNVTFVPTAEYYDTAAHELYEQNYWKGTPEQKVAWEMVGNDRPYHYLGSGKTYYLKGQAFGKAMLKMLTPAAVSQVDAVGEDCTQPTATTEHTSQPDDVSSASATTSSSVSVQKLAVIDDVVAEGLRHKKMPGCVVLVGHNDSIIYHKAFGHRQLVPEPQPMLLDTVFDLASLTKPIATATSVMALVESGQLDLDATVASIIPEFAANGKESITVRQLLAHTGGLIPDNSMKDYSDGATVAFQKICQLATYVPPGSKFVYSDVGFIVLAELVRTISGQTIHEYSQQHIFDPLGMKETGYLPAATLQQRAAVTQARDGKPMRGEVHDPRAYAMGGVAGHAGLFSTASDLAIYAKAMLNRGSYGDVAILKPETFELMTAPVEVSSGLRTLGWDMRSTYSSNRGDFFSKAAFGHGGFTGTALWIDPELKLFVIFLSNRVHPDGKGSINSLAGRIATIAGAAIQEQPHESSDR